MIATTPAMFQLQQMQATISAISTPPVSAKSTFTPATGYQIGAKTGAPAFRLMLPPDNREAVLPKTPSVTQQLEVLNGGKGGKKSR